ncbi:hypothetical protein JGI24_00191 [Candidatus Kryptobacter tengchongensis]|uniref:PorV/PorQ family protein n=1 Tax=Kryptobacter tengchongensis TaxID=1643429 RepID=A0A656D1T9_KRYT1|nr:hypothetical protein JGI24_00191 [Candidatus Kryptobacter tengchongensis]
MERALKIFLTLFVLCFQVLLSGGKTGFNFLSIGVDARVVSLADAGVALPPEIGTIYYNPSGLALHKKTSLLLTYRNWLVDGRFIYTSFSFPSRFSNFAISLTSFSIPDIEIRTRPSEAQGKFTFRDLSIAFSASPNWESRIKTGITVKYIFEKIFVDETHLVAFDFGILYAFAISRFNFYTGASLKDIGFKGKYRNSSVNLPSAISIGASASYSVAQSGIEILLLVEAKRKFHESVNLISTGFGFKFLSSFVLNLGYVSGRKLENLRFGGGIELNKIRLYYSFSSLEYNFPNSHTITINFNF